MKLDQREPTARRPWAKTDKRAECGHATATPKRKVEWHSTTVMRRRAAASGHSPRLRASWPRCPAPGKNCFAGVTVLACPNPQKGAPDPTTESLHH